ncbi:hypothetical protein LJ739_04825 [Aestuariibacter halophilus]|uniref:AMP-binding enzyme C-terminal domain-containing protein n=1 Tax=Fluctibacter halophilus TaxID=226011 RepID=A0ABS8G4X0_9ALTE|nr:hypothetical protein [Aestuariibacter halophilus]MCC2615559.1 hypothetical protein [Aestuariibacter halophilus]
MVFEQHGSFRLWCHGNVVYAELSGTWNKETAEQFAGEFKTLAQQVDKPWAHMVYLQDWELCSAEVFAVIQALVDWCLEHGLVRAAQVYPPSTMKREFLDRMVVERKGQFQRAVFDNAYQGALWLTHEGFEANVSKV